MPAAPMAIVTRAVRRWFIQCLASSELALTPNAFAPRLRAQFPASRFPDVESVPRDTSPGQRRQDLEDRQGAEHGCHLERRFVFLFAFARDFEGRRALGRVVGFALLFLRRLDAGLTRSGSLALPVSRFHSSKVSGEISPLTRSSANFRRCARLLKRMSFPA